MTFTYKNKIKCTREEAWSLIIDLERRPHWIHFQEKCYWLEKKPGMVGSRFQEKQVFLGIPLNVNYTVTEWKDLARKTSKCDIGPFYQTVDIVIEDAQDGIWCSLIIHAKVGPFVLVPEKFLRKQVDALIQPMVDKFSNMLEQESSLL